MQCVNTKRRKGDREMLAGIWAEVLKSERVGRHDNSLNWVDTR